MDGDRGRPQTGVEAAEALAADGERRRALGSWARASMGLSANDIEDVLQETYVELLRYTAPIHNPDGFAFRVFQTRCCHLHRYRRRRPDTTATEELLEGLAAAEAPAESRILVVEALRRLTPRCRQLILAFYIDGRKPRETVVGSGLSSAKIVSAITSRCLRRLRKWLLER